MLRGMAAATVLVLGGSGFLGAHAVRAAARAFPSAEVVSAARERGPAEAPRVRHLVLDALARDAVERALGELVPSHVLLATALARIDECERYPGLARALNADLPRRVARACAGLGARLVHVSTDLVFGGEPAPPSGFREEHAPAPLSEYGRSKAAGEEAVLAEHPGALVARLPLLHGPSDGRARGASGALLAAVERGERPALFADEWRTPLDVRDAAAALAELLARAESGRLHVGGPERLSRLELGLRVAAIHAGSRERAAELVRATTRAGEGMADRPEDVSLDSSRARALLATRLRGVDEALSALS